ncbi:hypothetical protein ACLOJK_009891 [Asimina triloba]
MRSMGLGKEGVGKNRGRSMGFRKNVGVEKKEGIEKKKERVERSMAFRKKVGVEKNEGIGKKKERVESSMGLRKKVGVEKKEGIGKKKERVEKKEGARKKKKGVGKNDGAGEERLIAGTKPSDRKGERMRRREREMGEGGEPRLRRTSQHPSLLPARFSLPARPSDTTSLTRNDGRRSDDSEDVLAEARRPTLVALKTLYVYRRSR